MREYRFRGKRVIDRQWIYGSLLISHFKDNPMPRYYITTFKGNYTFDHEVLPETIGQYADFKDDDDKEVWENDIVRVEYGMGKVIFHASCFMIQWIDDPEANMELLSRTSKMRARNSLKNIGNIHDNKELIQP